MHNSGIETLKHPLSLDVECAPELNEEMLELFDEKSSATLLASRLPKRLEMIRSNPDYLRYKDKFKKIQGSTMDLREIRFQKEKSLGNARIIFVVLTPSRIILLAVFKESKPKDFEIPIKLAEQRLSRIIRIIKEGS